jgi:hypothetical protein
MGEPTKSPSWSAARGVSSRTGSKHLVHHRTS